MICAPAGLCPGFYYIYAMPYEYLDHQADIGISSWGDSLEEALKDGAIALFGIMADPGSVEPRCEVSIECEAAEESLLFVEMLNALLTQADLSGYLLGDLTIDSIEHSGEGLRLRARACGEPLDTSKHEVGSEVKAATYSGLRYRTESGRHYLQCLLDI